MKTARMLTVLVVALGLLACSAQFARAAPMGTAFTYQGQLYDANYVANGLYDFAFKLYDANVAGSKVGTDVNVADVDVIDGYFTVELDFSDPNAFNGEAIWLEIGVRPGDMNDPNVYTVLSPRQEVTPTPYAIYAKRASSIAGGISGSGTANYIPKFTDADTIGDSVISESGGNIGVGVTEPKEKLDVRGNLSIGTTLDNAELFGRLRTYVFRPMVDISGHYIDYEISLTDANTEYIDWFTFAIEANFQEGQNYNTYIKATTVVWTGHYPASSLPMIRFVEQETGYDYVIGESIFNQTRLPSAKSTGWYRIDPSWVEQSANGRTGIIRIKVQVKSREDTAGWAHIIFKGLDIMVTDVCVR